MTIAIIGAGNIGEILASQLSKAGHEVTICFTRDEKKLKERAYKIGNGVQSDSVSEAVKKSEVVILSVRWEDIDTILKQTKDLSGKIVIDTTNPYGSTGLIDIGTSAAAFNQARMPGAKLVRTFNMFFARYLSEVGNGQHRPVAMFFATEDNHAKDLATQLITDTGFEPVYLGGWDVAKLIEVPSGILVGKAYRPKDAHAIANAVQQNNIALVSHLIKNVRE